jgi:bifunctional UDP-N-acetylglucosamine pyrophosphorylase / glucosamine-1-phosphate N-acetyltransferase
MMSAPLTSVVLAAGEGTRMRSTRPKPLHLLCGRAMLLHILDAVAEVPVSRAVVVVGHGAERVTKKLTEQGPPDLLIDFVEQVVQRGTGDAAMAGLTAFPDEPDDDEGGGDVLVVPGDTPLLLPATLAELVAVHREAEAAATVLTARVPDPTGYGRVVRGRDGGVARVVEQADATADEREIDEINTGIYCFRRSVLAPALRRLSPQNALGEYYLTDVLEVLSDAGYPVRSFEAEDARTCMGVNDRVQLAAAEAELRRRTNERWLRQGVTMLDPERTYLDTTVRLAPDVTLFPGAILQGSTVVGERAEIGPDTRLVDCTVGADAVVASTFGVDAEVGAGARVGPFAALEPGSSIAPGAVTGPFYTSTDRRD